MNNYVTLIERQFNNTITNISIFEKNKIKMVEIQFIADDIQLSTTYSTTFDLFKKESANIYDVLSTRFEIANILKINGFVNNQKTSNGKTYKISHNCVFYTINNLQFSSDAFIEELQKINLIV